LIETASNVLVDCACTGKAATVASKSKVLARITIFPTVFS
jgi:hypothetical protein